jgi:dethiobiotin synthetase
MQGKPARGLFITGTGTGVGKTYVGCLIAAALREAGHRVGVYKPVASGCVLRGDRLVSDDAAALAQAAGRPLEHDQVCPQCFALPVAPHLAARAEGREVDANLLRHGLSYWRETCNIVLVEGAGGLMSPITDEQYVADLAQDFAYPLVIVAPNALGVINATLQTLITARNYRGGLPVAGIVLNNISPPGHDPSIGTNHSELARRCQPPVLAEVGFGADRFDTDIDWFALAAAATARA